MQNNLPPGCTASDVERNAGSMPAPCESCGAVMPEARLLDEEGRCQDCRNTALYESQVNDLEALFSDYPNFASSSNDIAERVLENKSDIVIILNREA